MSSANERNHADSRTFGFVPDTYIIGRLSRILYSWDTKVPLVCPVSCSPHDDEGVSGESKSMMMNTVCLLSTTYFGPVQYYAKLYAYPEVWMEAHEHYVKQTYRNRCLIASPSGVQALTVPVVKPGTDKCLMKDIRISDHGNWRHLHWNALETAYRNSPFFEYYADDFLPFYTQKWDFLFDFNEAIRAKVCELIDLHPKVLPTASYGVINGMNSVDSAVGYVEYAVDDFRRRLARSAFSYG